MLKLSFLLKPNILLNNVICVIYYWLLFLWSGFFVGNLANILESYGWKLLSKHNYNWYFFRKEENNMYFVEITVFDLRLEEPSFE